ncbi:MAG: hypothetical protein ACR2KC_05030, partial [Acidimicrobiales bacterium]
MTPGRRATVGAAAGAAVAWTAIMLLRLFAGGAVGMGDQGDSRRLLCQLGVRSTAPFNADRAAYLYPTWVAHHWYGEACSGDGSGGVFRSSELWLLSMAKHLTPILGLPGALDLRALGIICSVLVGVCVGLWVLALPGGIVTRVGVASLVGLLVADGAFADTLISPYSEPAELIGILALCPVLLLLWRRGHTTWPTLAAVAGVATVVISAKTQAAALAPAIVLAVLWLPAGRTGTGPEPAAGRARKALLARLPALFVTLAVGGAAAYFVATASPGLTEQNVYASVFGEILVHSPDPAGDLRSLGADPHLVTAIGSNPESSNA